MHRTAAPYLARAYLNSCLAGGFAVKVRFHGAFAPNQDVTINK